MAALILAMLFIGIGMVGSLADYARLVAIHRPLGMAILCSWRSGWSTASSIRRRPCPGPCRGWQRFAAHASHPCSTG